MIKCNEKCCWRRNPEASGLFNDFINIWRRGIPWNPKTPQGDFVDVRIQLKRNNCFAPLQKKNFIILK